MGEVVRVDFEMNEDFFPTLGHSPLVGALLDTAGDAILAYAKAIAPYKTGTYERSLHKERSSTPYRFIDHVVSDDPIAPIIEARFGVLHKAMSKGRI